MEKRTDGDLLHWWTPKQDYLVAWWDADAGEYVYRPLSRVGKLLDPFKEYTHPSPEMGYKRLEIIKRDSEKPEREQCEGLGG